MGAANYGKTTPTSTNFTKDTPTKVNYSTPTIDTGIVFEDGIGMVFEDGKGGLFVSKRQKATNYAIPSN